MDYQPKHAHREQDGERIPCGCPEIQISDTESRIMHVDGCRDAERDKIREAMRTPPRPLRTKDNEGF